jgi:non-ribosomal peptide synthetase component E (peptide arylation enzyme)
VIIYKDEFTEKYEFSSQFYIKGFWRNKKCHPFMEEAATAADERIKVIAADERIKVIAADERE